MCLSEARACSWLAPNINPNSCVGPSVMEKGYHIRTSVIITAIMSRKVHPVLNAVTVWELVGF